MFKGSIVALVTPFKDGQVDQETFGKLIERQIQAGTHGLVPCGTTGESPTLTPDEHNRVIEICVKTANKRVPVIAGTGSNSTAEAITLTRHAEHAGADAALVVTPYYNKPTQEGLYRHFKAVADSVKIPIILYNIESRSARNIETETVKRLAKDCKNIVGVKEASGSIQQAKDVKSACGNDFVILSGDDALTIPLMDIGGRGIISVVANLVPEDVANMVNAYEQGNKELANELNEKLKPLVSAMFIETNPVPVKTAMAAIGLCSEDVRLPLCELEEKNRELLMNALEQYGILSATKG